MANRNGQTKTGIPVVLPVQTPWVPYVPVINDQVATGVSFMTRQNGYNREIAGRFTMATNNATSAFFSLPYSETVDSVWMAGANRFLSRFTSSNGTATVKAGNVIGNSADLANLYFSNDDASAARAGLTPTTWSAFPVQTISFFLSVPTNFTVANPFTAYGAGQALAARLGLVKAGGTSVYGYSQGLASTTTTSSPSTFTPAVQDTSIISSAISSGGGSTIGTGTLTLTFAVSGRFRIDHIGRIGSGASTTAKFYRASYGGSATRLTQSSFDSGAEYTSNIDLSNVNSAIYDVIAGQTVTVNPICYAVFSTGSHNMSGNVIVTPLSIT